MRKSNTREEDSALNTSRASTASAEATVRTVAMATAVASAVEEATDRTVAATATAGKAAEAILPTVEEATADTKADTATKAYTGQNDIFADAFNFYLYGGRQVLHPEQLNELDSTELSYPFGADGRGEPVQKYRDVLKSAVFMENGKAAYLLLGIENQTSVHYAAPVKNLLYDAL